MDICSGHVLVCPQRSVKRMSELTPEEVYDVFLLAQKVGTVAQQIYSAASLTFAVQDGPEAGQTVQVKI